ncbi:hypothetical protein B296_00005855 [Ensete ventricosum]|uniref:Uncharacterized protein n=1 Tax=Ensete ventricosum TaxID=4639 RepID=A0A426ZMI6_ENSVE|nr:hypothetical protein B296_00005855 [Ensete ventricosum]
MSSTAASTRSSMSDASPKSTPQLRSIKSALSAAVYRQVSLAHTYQTIRMDVEDNRVADLVDCFSKKFGVTEFVNPADHKKPVQEV